MFGNIHFEINFDKKSFGFHITYYAAIDNQEQIILLPDFEFFY